MLLDKCSYLHPTHEWCLMTAVPSFKTFSWEVKFFCEQTFLTTVASTADLKVAYALMQEERVLHTQKGYWHAILLLRTSMPVFRASSTTLSISTFWPTTPSFIIPGSLTLSLYKFNSLQQAIGLTGDLLHQTTRKFKAQPPRPTFSFHA